MQPDQVYGTLPGRHSPLPLRELHVDVYEPSGSTNYRTGVLVLHGGGFRMGSRKLLQPRCEMLAAAGFTALAVEYRLLDEAAWPAQLLDVKAAIRWVKANADDLGIDPGKVAIQGHSSGAHLALMAVGTVGLAEFDREGESEFDTSVAAVAAFYPPVSFAAGVSMPPAGPPSPESVRTLLATMNRADGTTPAAMLLGNGADQDEALTASPITYVSEKSPPTIIFQGTADQMVSPAASRLLYEKLSAAGVPVEWHLFSGVTHEFDSTPSFGAVTTAAVALFFRRYISEAQILAEEVLTNPMAAMAAMAASS